MVLDELLNEDFVLGFDDESAQKSDINRCRIWGEKGNIIKTHATDAMTVNTMGFYPLNGNPVCAFPDRGNAESFGAFLEKVREANGDRTIVMVLDNCRIHKTQEVRDAAARLDIRLCYLPPYFPQYNPIELIWKTMKFELSKHGILDRCQVESVVQESFMNAAVSLSYAKYWVDIFMELLPKKLCY